MANFTRLNNSLDGDNTGYSETRLPLYLSTNTHIPHVLIREIPIVWASAGVMFNGLLIYYLLAAKRYRSPVFMLILNLSIADLLVCMCGICFASFIWPSYVLPETTWPLCKIVYYIFAVSVSASTYYLVLFASMRFYQLTFPLQARVRVTSNFIRNWCLLIMSIAAAAWSPFLVSYDLIYVIYDDHKSVICEYTGHLITVRNFAFLIVNTSIPGISILVLHLLKYVRVSDANVATEGQQQERKNTDIRAVIIVIVVFYITWTPVNLYLFVYEYLPNHLPYQDNMYLILVYLCSSNSSLNPLIYCMAARSVRNDLAYFICAKQKTKGK